MSRSPVSQQSSMLLDKANGLATVSWREWPIKKVTGIFKITIVGTVEVGKNLKSEEVLLLLRYKNRFMLITVPTTNGDVMVNPEYVLYVDKPENLNLRKRMAEEGDELPQSAFAIGTKGQKEPNYYESYLSIEELGKLLTNDEGGTIYRRI